MLERGRGAIINVSSTLAHAPPTPLLAAEAASMVSEIINKHIIIIINYRGLLVYWVKHYMKNVIEKI